VRLTIKGGQQSSKYGKHILDYRKKLTRMLRISGNINFTNYGVINSADSRMIKVGGPLRGQGKSRGGSINVYPAW